MPPEHPKNNAPSSNNEASRVSALLQMEQSEYIKTLNGLPSEQRNAIASDAAAKVVKSLNIPYQRIGESLSSKTKTPEQKKIVAEYNQEIVKSMKNVESHRKYFSSLNELRAMDVYNGSAEHLFEQALDVVSKKMEIPSNVLRLFCEEESLYKKPTDLQKPILISDRLHAITEVNSTFIELEEKHRLNALDMSLSNIDSLIEEVKVSPLQKEQWKQLLSLEIPKNSRIKVIPIIGGAGLSMSGEIEHLKKGLEKAKGKSTLTFANAIDNMQLTKEETLATIQREQESDDIDFVIIYASTHGFTPSINTLQVSARLGFTELDSPDDVFHIQNEKANQEAGEKYRNYQDYYPRASAAVEELLKSNPRLFYDEKGAPRIYKSGEIIQVGTDNIRVIEDIGRPDQLVSRLTLLLFTKDLMKGSVSTDDLAEIQQELLKKYPQRKTLYILDNCFSGSATNDRLAELPSTEAILAASSADEPAFQKSDAPQGEFMNELFRNLEFGNSLGEAFIRSDIKLNFLQYPRLQPSPQKNWQNPSATVKDKNGETIRVSSIFISPQDEKIS